MRFSIFLLLAVAGACVGYQAIWKKRIVCETRSPCHLCRDHMTSVPVRWRPIRTYHIGKLRNLMRFTSNLMEKFLDSFDTVVTDCDGVLWLGNTPIRDSLDTLKKLQSLGKRIVFVSNNNIFTLEEYRERFRRMGFPASVDQIAIPSSAISWYLKKSNYSGKAFVVGTDTFQRVLKSNGLDIVEPPPNHVDGLEDVLQQLRKDPDVSAVIVDFDPNVNWLKISRSIQYLKSRQVLFLTGALDRKIPIGNNATVLGIGSIVDIISEEANRIPIQCGKPSEIMKDYVINKFQINNPSRAIYIGDSFESDMKFASLCGFTTLWVASGVDTLETIVADRRTTKDASSIIPDYFLPTLGDLLDNLDVCSVKHEQRSGLYKIESLCAMIRIDPETGVLHKTEPTNTLRSFREETDPNRVEVDGKYPTMGVYCGLYESGAVKIHDKVFVKQIPAK